MGDTPTAPDRDQTVARVLRLISTEGDFPAVSRFLTEMLAVARNPNVSAQSIAALILKDFALTNSILRMVNSAYYSASETQKVSTISRALLVLGIDAVVNMASALNVFEHFSKHAGVKELKRLTIDALLTGLHARELARGVRAVQPEEAFICGMLHNLGRMTVAFYLPAEQAEIARLASATGIDEETACVRTIGLSYRELGEEVAKAWQFPAHVHQSIGGLDEGEAPAATSAQARLRSIVSCARELSAATVLSHESARDETMSRIRERYGEHLPLAPRQLRGIVETSAQRFSDLAVVLHITRKDLEVHAPGLVPPPPAPPAPAPAPPPRAEPPPASTPVGVRAPGAAEPPPPAHDAPALPSREERQRVFVRALEDVAYALANDCALNDVFMMILEGMYRGIGFNHVVLALVTPKRELLKGRYGLGTRAHDVVAGFSVSLADPSGLMAQAITGPRELHVPDTDAPAVRAALPAEFLHLTEAKRFMVLPIVVQNVAIGGFYVDRAAGEPPIDETEQRNLRTLVNHAILAVRQSPTRRSPEGPG